MNSADTLAMLADWAGLANAIGLGVAIAMMVPLLLILLAVLIWSTLPRGKHADIERQIKTLRREDDHAVTTRPRVRGNGCSAPPVTHIKAAPQPCGGGQCRHRADCADHHCPGRQTASQRGTQHHAQH